MFCMFTSTARSSRNRSGRPQSLQLSNICSMLGPGLGYAAELFNCDRLVQVGVYTIPLFWQLWLRTVPS